MIFISQRKLLTIALTNNTKNTEGTTVYTEGVNSSSFFTVSLLFYIINASHEYFSLLEVVKLYDEN